jgi:hypothetical protein
VDIGNPVHRVVLGLAGIITAFALVLCITPVGAAPANDRAAVYTGSPKAHAPKRAERPDRDAKPAAEPKRVHRTHSADADRHDNELAQVSNAAGEPLDVSDECAENLALAAQRGLTLPKGWDIKCVGPGLDWSGNSHWGVACPYDSCPEGAGPYLSISNPNYYVIAHELCHANFGTDELAADECAAEHGASLETSPYQ